MAVALVAWAVASPVGATADEEYHLASIWCAQGERDGLCEAAPESDQRELLGSLLTAPCFAFDPDASAACQGDSLAADRELVVSDRGNFDGNYPPVFYFVMGLFASGDVVRSVLAMRIFNALFALVLVTAVWLASPPGLRRGLVAGATVTLVPLSMFLLPSVNPSSWAILSAMTLAVAVLGFLTVEDRRRRVALGTLAAVALVTGAGARSDASIYALVAIGAAVIVTWHPLTRRRLALLAYPLVLGACATVAFLAAGQSGLVGGDAPMETSFRFLLWTLVEVPLLWTGALGQTGLGWLDTQLPGLVWIAAWSALVGVVFAALRGLGRRQTLVVLLVGTGLWVVSGYVQYISGHPVGAWVQPRYLLPLIVVLAIVACVRVGGSVPLRLATSQWLLVVLALSVANSLALHTNIRRYVTGADVRSTDLGAGIEWWWDTPVGPMAVWALGSVAFALAVTALTAALREAPE